MHKKKLQKLNTLDYVCYTIYIENIYMNVTLSLILLNDKIDIFV